MSHRNRSAIVLLVLLLAAPLLAIPAAAQGPAPSAAPAPSSPVERAVFDAAARVNAGDFKGGLKVLEPTPSLGADRQSGEVVSLADWGDSDLTRLMAHEPEPTGVIVVFEHVRH